ncbi:Glucanosyltransferase-domain-containing protein [Sporodiniella umbellata]|nr:Glucanosyltransferase-domain-containing protein [Sporodiniella umbellata]
MKLSVIILLCASSAFALNPIITQGSKFFDSVTKEQFFIKGVAYQPRGQVKSGIMDPLANPAACARDAAMMAKLGTNVLRVYEVDPTLNHDDCMKSFADAGIYLILDIATPKFSVNRKTPEYTIHLYNAYKATVDAFINYDNLFAFIAGNEVTNDKTSTLASAYVKASLRDIKQYVRSTKKNIAVGYASNDDEFIRDDIKSYFNCGDEESQADFFGVNLYEWCGTSSFELSGYRERTKEFESYSKPVFLSEYGCNLVIPRPFTEVAALYGPDMTHTWSGGIVYEWTQENNQYGLVSIDDQGNAVELPDFQNLQRQLERVQPNGVTLDTYQEQKSTAACPEMSDHWKASSVLPPTPSEGACQCMVENLECVASEHVKATADTSSNNTLGVQLDVMCSLTSCADINGDAEKGEYGMFSFCSPRDKLSWLYDSHSKKEKNCNYEGLGQEVKPRRHDVQKCANVSPNSNNPSEPTDSTNDPYVPNTNTPSIGTTIFVPHLILLASTAAVVFLFV